MFRNKQTAESLISRDASDSIKGLLIILVVLGHNSILCQKWDGDQIIEPYFYWQLLYTFHVYCFFILPFLYNKNTYQIGNLKKYAIRFLYPYLWICLICFITYAFILGNFSKNWSDVIWAIISGDEKTLGENIGFNFPWFLPAMFMLLILKDIYYSINKYIKIILLSISLLLWIAALLLDIKFSTISLYVPLSLVPAFRLLPICILTTWLIYRINFTNKSRIFFVIIFTILTIIFYLFLHYGARYRLIFYFIMPITAFLLIMAFKDYLAKSRLLITMGKFSLQIYLYHVFIFNIFLILAKHIHHSPTILDGMIILITTYSISYIGAWLTTKILLLKNILYPQNK